MIPRSKLEYHSEHAATLFKEFSEIGNDRYASSSLRTCTVYVKNRDDYSAIKKVFENYYGKLPVVYILADICRHDLLVEIEGEAILE